MSDQVVDTCQPPHSLARQARPYKQVGAFFADSSSLEYFEQNEVRMLRYLLERWSIGVYPWQAGSMAAWQHGKLAGFRLIGSLELA